MAKNLKESGLNGINISLDTLKKDKYRNLTKFNGLDQVLKSLDVVSGLKFDSLKVQVI